MENESTFKDKFENRFKDTYKSRILKPILNLAIYTSIIFGSSTYSQATHLHLEEIPPGTEKNYVILLSEPIGVIPHAKIDLIHNNDTTTYFTNNMGNIEIPSNINFKAIISPTTKSKQFSTIETIIDGTDKFNVVDVVLKSRETETLGYLKNP